VRAGWEAIQEQRDSPGVNPANHNAGGASFRRERLRRGKSTWHSPLTGKLGTRRLVARLLVLGALAVVGPAQQDPREFLEGEVLGASASKFSASSIP
jgi:hypothetical protein